MIGLLIFGAFWIVCGTFAWSRDMAEWTRKYPWANHRGICAFAALLGPIGALEACLNTLGSGCGFRFRPLSKEEAWAAHDRKWPGLSRDEFERTY